MFIPQEFKKVGETAVSTSSKVAVEVENYYHQLLHHQLPKAYLNSLHQMQVRQVLGVPPAVSGGLLPEHLLHLGGELAVLGQHHRAAQRVSLEPP